MAEGVHAAIEVWQGYAQTIIDATEGLFTCEPDARNAINYETGASLYALTPEQHERLREICRSLAGGIQHLTNLGYP